MPDKSFPTNEADTNLLFQTMKTQLPLVNGQLGLAAADVNFFVVQADNYQYILNVTQEISDQREAFTAFKKSLLDGDPKDTPPDPPVFTIITLPQPAFNGMEAEAKAIIKRIKASAGYNTTIGEQLGLVDTGEAPLNPNALTAELKCTAKPDGVVEIAFSKQGQDAMRGEFKRKNDTEWQLAGIWPTSPATHNVPSVPPGDPESRQYRGVLIKKNEPIGNYSPIYTIVTTP
ncbi:MAG: hypothetical protein ABL952_11145 [Pyrinomonadaceae bacterium]